MDALELSRKEKIGVVATDLVNRGFGAACSNKELVEWSGFKADSQELSRFVSAVRHQLVQYGMWLSGEGQEGKGFFIVRPSENALVAAHYSNKARRAEQVMQSLLENTPLDQLTEAEKRRHDKELREIRYVNRLAARKDEVEEVLKQHKPGLLKEDITV